MKKKSTLLTSVVFQFIFTGAIAIAAHPEPDPAFTAAASECASENGVTLPTPGTKPSKEGWEAFKKIGPCMEAKGFKVPPPHPHHRGHHDDSSDAKPETGSAE